MSQVAAPQDSELSATSERAAAGHERNAVTRLRAGLATVLRGGTASLAVPLVMAALVILLPFYYHSPYWLYEGALIAVLALVVSGVNLSFGYAGELQLGQVFMFAVGAYVSMILAVRGFNDVLLLMLVGGGVAAAVGLLVAVPSLRIGGWALAIVSFFLVITIPDFTTVFTSYTGGLNGLVGIPVPRLFGHPLGNVGMFEVTVITTVVWFAAYRNLVTSRYGVVFKVMRESPVLGRSLGYSTLRLKTLLYVLGAFPAGVAGCLFGYIAQVVHPDSFSLAVGIGTVAASVLGGTESVYSILIGAAILQLGPERSAGFASYAPVFYGAFLVVAAVLLRRGVGGLAKIGARRAAAWIEPGRARPVQTDTSRTDTSREPTVADTVGGSTRTLPAVAGLRFEVRDIEKSFGGVAALKGVSIAAEAGQVTALIGSNGSGKTTLLNVICGYIPADRGSVMLHGVDISRLKPHRIAKRGVGRTFQTPTIPHGVAVRDVVASGRYAKDHVGFLAAILRLPRYWRAQRADRQEAEELLRRVGLAQLADREAASLPLGTRRLVEVVRALCGRPGALLLDEPASGLNDEEARRLAMLVRAVAEAGATVIVIEHNFRFVTSIADTVHVLHLGELIASGPPATIAADRQVVRSYLGEATVAPRRPNTTVGANDASADDVVLRIEDIESGYGDLQILRGVTMSIGAGSIEAVLGRNGVGKTTLLSTVAGLVPTWKGSVSLLGQPVTRHTAYRRSAEGVVLVQEGKRIFRHRTVRQNVMLGTHTLRMSRQERHKLCQETLEHFPVLRDRAEERAGGLSGGQQQMLAIAQALASRPKVLLLDEPSAGLAPSVTDEVFAKLRALADDGLSIVLVEQLAEKAVAIADHVTVLDDGKVVAAGSYEMFQDVSRLEETYFAASS